MHYGPRLGHTCDLCGEALVGRVPLQTDGATPLFVTSQNGHLECVQALLEGGAAIDQAMVGCAGSNACVAQGCMVGCPSTLGWHAVGYFGQSLNFAYCSSWARVLLAPRYMAGRPLPSLAIETIARWQQPFSPMALMYTCHWCVFFLMD